MGPLHTIWLLFQKTILSNQLIVLSLMGITKSRHKRNMSLDVLCLLTFCYHVLFFPRLCKATKLIFCALNSLLKTIQETDSSKPLPQWPTYAAILKKLTEEDGINFFQSQEIQGFADAESFFTAHCEDYCKLSNVSGLDWLGLTFR